MKLLNPSIRIIDDRSVTVRLGCDDGGGAQVQETLTLAYIIIVSSRAGSLEARLPFTYSPRLHTTAPEAPEAPEIYDLGSMR